MTARSRMTLRTDVLRDATQPLDDSGNPLPQPDVAPAAYLEDVPVWLYSSSERESVTEDTTAVVTDLKAMVPLGTDITEQDRLNGIRDRRGTTVEPGVLLVEEVLYKRSHLQLVLSRVGG